MIKAFGTSLRIVKDLFPAFKPLVVAAGKALDGFLKSIANWLGSPSGHKFIIWPGADRPERHRQLRQSRVVDGQAFGRTADFMYNTGHRMIQHLKDISSFFTRVMPAALHIANDAVTLAFDKMVINAATAAAGESSASSPIFRDRWGTVPRGTRRDQATPSTSCSRTPATTTANMQRS